MSRSVLHVTDSSAFGGAEQAILTLLEGLDRDRWAPTLVHHPAPGIEPLVRGAHAIGVPTWSVPRMDPGLHGLARLPGFVTAVRSRRPAIVHAHLTWPLACQYALLGSWLARTPAVVATVQLHVSVSLSRRVDIQQRLSTRFVDRYIAVSEHVRDRVVDEYRWPRDKVDVVPNSVAWRDFDPPAGSTTRAGITDDPAAPLALVPARLEDQKGHVHLLEAATRLPEVRFALAGDGSRRAALEARARALGVADRVRFLGHRDDMPALLAASDIVVLPSLSEGLPIALLEAMAAGTPVIASAIGGVNELVRSGENGLLVPPRDPAALASAIRTLTSDPVLAADHAAAAKECVRRRYSADEMCSRVQMIYDDVSGAS
jgi:glycosyltransferase involved in cell wall biosynthesis